MQVAVLWQSNYFLCTSLVVQAVQFFLVLLLVLVVVLVPVWELPLLVVEKLELLL